MAFAPKTISAARGTVQKPGKSMPKPGTERAVANCAAAGQCR